MRKMVFGLGVLALIAAFVAGFIFFVPRGGDTPLQPEDGRLCRELPSEEIDFTILNDSYGLIKDFSVYRKTADDPYTLLRGGIQQVFQQFGVPEENIPQWVWDEIDAEIAKGKIEFTVFQRIFERLRDDPQYQNDPAYQDFRNPSVTREFFQKAIEGVFRKGLKDPFASYIDAEAVRLGQTDLPGQYQGVGMRHDLQDGKFIIAEVFPGQPAEKAGMRINDEVLAVDGKSLEGCSSYAFTNAVRGREGTVVTLTVKRPDGTIEDVRITRAVISLAVVSSCPGYDLPGGRGKSDRELPECPLRGADGKAVNDVLYIKFSEFTEVAAGDLAAILRQADLSQFRGIVLDMRANPGGRVDVLMRTLDYFFQDRVIFKYTDFSRSEFARGFGIVNVEPTDEGLFRAYYAYDRFDYATEIPVVLLIGRDPNSQTRRGADNNSFSASEGFMGAMQDLGRATVLGEGRTGGKGTTNQTFLLRNGDEGALYLAIGLWRTPDGRTPQGEDLDGDGYEDTGGLMPDLVVRWTDEDYDNHNNDPAWDPVFFKALEVLRDKAP